MCGYRWIEATVRPPHMSLSAVSAQMMYGRLYLNNNLFKELARCFKRNIVLILAEKEGKVRPTM